MRTALLILALVLALGLAACGKKNEPDPPGGPANAIGVKPYPRS